MKNLKCCIPLLWFPWFGIFLIIESDKVQSCVSIKEFYFRKLEVWRRLVHHQPVKYIPLINAFVQFHLYIEETLKITQCTDYEEDYYTFLRYNIYVCIV